MQTNSKYVNKTNQNPKQMQQHLLQNVPTDLPDLLPKNRWVSLSINGILKSSNKINTIGHSASCSCQTIPTG